MKKYLHKLCALLLVCMVFASVVVPASAAENGAKDVLAQEGKVDDWYIIEGRATGQLFTIVANNVWNSLYSQASSKGFATYQHTGETIKFSGNLYHSTSTTAVITYGLCHVSPYTGEFQSYSSTRKKIASGNAIDLQVPVNSLPTYENYPTAQTYYAFILNGDSSGYIHGNLTLTAE